MADELCKYANVFGEPNKGAHAVRVGGLAIVDVLATGGLALLLIKCFGHEVSWLAFALVFIILGLAGIVLHELFCVNTRFNAALFGRPWPAPHPCQDEVSTSAAS